MFVHIICVQIYVYYIIFTIDFFVFINKVELVFIEPGQNLPKHLAKEEK